MATTETDIPYKMSTALPATFVPNFHSKEQIKEIRYNKFGNTGLSVSHLSFGGATVAYSNSAEEENEAINTVIKAIKSGINYIDTAPYYGEGKSELVLGKALRKIPREAYYIGTKVGRYSLDIRNMFDFSASRTLKSFDESLKRLNLDYVDVIQVHDVEFAPNIDIVVNETLPALQAIKSSGRAKYIGITGYVLQTLKDIVELSEVKIDFVLSYCRCTLFDDALLEYIPYYKSKEVGVINAAVLGMSLLTNSRLPSWHPVKPTLRSACEDAVQYCQAKGVDIAKLSLYHPLSQSDVCTHLVGMVTTKVLAKNLDVLLNGLTKKETEVLEEVQEKFFRPLQERNWENGEVEKYWKRIRELESL